MKEELQGETKNGTPSHIFSLNFSLIFKWLMKTISKETCTVLPT